MAVPILSLDQEGRH